MNKKQEVLFAAVKNAIDKWNPYGFLPEAPRDEFDSESKAVAEEVKRNMDSLGKGRFKVEALEKER